VRLKEKRAAKNGSGRVNKTRMRWNRLRRVARVARCGVAPQAAQGES